MTFTLTIPTMWGLLFAAITGYIWISIASEESGVRNPALAVGAVVLVQFVMFLLVYGLMTLCGL